MITDSAGVEIVTTTATGLDDAQTWGLGNAPVTEIRSSDTGNPVLFGITEVVPLPGGEIAVGNSEPLEVLVFGSDGNQVRSFGREGEGPGEFGSISSIVALPGDSIGVYDVRRRRFTVFSPSGEASRSFDTRDLNPPGGSSRILLLSSGQFLLFGEGGFGDETGIHRTPAESFVLSATGIVVRTIGPFPGGETYVLESGGRGPVIFGAKTLSVTLEDRVVVGLSDGPELRTYEKTGVLTRILRWDMLRRPVTEEDVAMYLDVALATVPETQRQVVRRFLSSLPSSSEAPVYEKLLASDLGELWVGLFQSPVLASGVPRQPQRDWLVFSSRGAVRFRLRTPGGFDLRAVRNHTAIGVFTDELGVESIRAYEVISPVSMSETEG
jgi:hypothetical protein